MFRAEYGARPKLIRERRPWNVRRSSKPFLDERSPLGWVCCISTEHLIYSWSICIVSLGRPSWTSLELGDYHAPSLLIIYLSVKQNLDKVWFLGSHSLGKLILLIIYLSVKQNLDHAWFLKSHTLGKLILLIIYLSVKQNIGHARFLGSHILGKLILLIIYASIKQNLGHA